MVFLNINTMYVQPPGYKYIIFYQYGRIFYFYIYTVTRRLLTHSSTLSDYHVILYVIHNTAFLNINTMCEQPPDYNQ